MYLWTLWTCCELCGHVDEELVDLTIYVMFVMLIAIYMMCVMVIAIYIIPVMNNMKYILCL
jgi:hypothetical protein